MGDFHATTIVAVRRNENDICIGEMDRSQWGRIPS